MFRKHVRFLIIITFFIYSDADSLLLKLLIIAQYLELDAVIWL